MSLLKFLWVSRKWRICSTSMDKQNPAPSHASADVPCSRPPPCPPAASLSTAARVILSPMCQGRPLLCCKSSLSHSEYKPQFFKCPEHSYLWS